jgi:hypothetical protein
VATDRRALIETRHSSALKTPLVTSGEPRHAPCAARAPRARLVEERHRADGDRVTSSARGAALTVSIASQPALGALLRAFARRCAAISPRSGGSIAELEGAPTGRSRCSVNPGMAELVTVIRIGGVGERLTGMEVLETAATASSRASARAR